MRSQSSCFLVSMFAIVSASTVAGADTYYVSPDGDDEAAGTAAAPFATPDGCFTNMSAGDSCLFMTGSWAGKAPNRYTPRWNTCNGPRGSAGQPTVYAAAPGAAPVFESFGASGSADNNPDPCQHIHIEGIHTTESFLVWSVDHLRVTGCEMEGGMDCDGNWSAVRFEHAADVLFDHNYVHRLADGGGCRIQALLTSFTTDRSIFEYNTLDSTDGVDPEYGAFLMKDSPIDIDIRFNLVIGDHIRGSNQNADGRLGRDLRIYGNVVIGGAIWSWVLTEDTSIRHNTLIGGALVADGSYSPRLLVRDNLVAGGERNFAMEDSYWVQAADFDIDYNVYDADGEYLAGFYLPDWQTHDSLSGWRTDLQAEGCSGCEDHSQELDCDFTSGADTDYHISGGACATAASDGSEAGAYALTDCVGLTCGAPVTPSADAGVPAPDGGGETNHDGGATTADAGNGPDDSAPSGCGCQTRRGSTGRFAGALLIAGLLISRLRRRSRAR